MEEYAPITECIAPTYGLARASLGELLEAWGLTEGSVDDQGHVWVHMSRVDIESVMRDMPWGEVCLRCGSYRRYQSRVDGEWVGWTPHEYSGTVARRWDAHGRR